jgi:hypothetical protein
MTEEHALDAADPLAGFRERFDLPEPTDPKGRSMS